MDATEQAVRLILRWSHPPDVAKVADVDRSTAYRWKKGGELPPYRVTQLAQAFGIPDGTWQTVEEAAPPEWVERLLVGTLALEEKGGVTDEELERARARALIHLAAQTQKRLQRGGGGGGAVASP